MIPAHRMIQIKLLSANAIISNHNLITATGDVAEKIHKLFIRAAEYRGCVEAQAETPEHLSNKCPSNHAYIDDGQCQRVYCDWVGLGGSHQEPLIAGKST